MSPEGAPEPSDVATRDAAARAAERAFLGLEMQDGAPRAVLPVTERLCTTRDSLYGGAVLATAITAMETATARRIVWATAQLVGNAPLGEHIELSIDELARGRRSSQVLVRASTPAGVVFTALGATGEEQADAFAADYARMPDVVPPDHCEPMFPADDDGRRGYQTVIDIRAAGTAADARPPALHAWARTPGRCTSLPAMIAAVADQLPYAVAHLAGAPGAGASLDNTLRVGPRSEQEWVLLELRPDLAARGYGHGSVWVWGRDGTLLAVGSQTSAMRSEMRFRAWPNGPAR